MKKKVPVLAQKFWQFCEANKAWGDSEVLWDELIDMNHMKVIEQNKIYFSNKKKQIEELWKWENIKLEDLIA